MIATLIQMTALDRLWRVLKSLKKKRQQEAPVIDSWIPTESAFQLITQLPPPSCEACTHYKEPVHASFRSTPEDRLRFGKCTLTPSEAVTLFAEFSKLDVSAHIIAMYSDGGCWAGITWQSFQLCNKGRAFSAKDSVVKIPRELYSWSK